MRVFGNLQQYIFDYKRALAKGRPMSSDRVHVIFQYNMPLPFDLHLSLLYSCTVKICAKLPLTQILEFDKIFRTACSSPA